MDFITSTTFNQVFFRHCIIITQCVFILLLLKSRKSKALLGETNIEGNRKAYGFYHGRLVQVLPLGIKE